MKRIVRLTESDLTRIVRRVIMEQGNPQALNITGLAGPINGEIAFNHPEKNRTTYYNCKSGALADENGTAVQLTLTTADTTKLKNWCSGNTRA